MTRKELLLLLGNVAPGAELERDYRGQQLSLHGTREGVVVHVDGHQLEDWKAADLRAALALLRDIDQLIDILEANT